MITKEDYKEAASMDQKQATILRAAIRANRKAFIEEPQDALDSLRYAARGELDAHNRFSRRLWAKRWGGHLGEVVGARAADWVPTKKVYLATITDREQLFAADRKDRLVHAVSAVEAALRYQTLLKGLDAFGMIEGKLYVYLPQEYGFYRAVNWHAHVLIWDVSPDEIDAWKRSTRKKMKAFDKGATAVDVQEVDRTWLILIGYLNKMPGSEYRVGSGKRKPSVDWTNGVNATFLYSAFTGATLDQITLAAGEGKEILRRSLQDAKRFTGSAPKSSGNSHLFSARTYAPKRIDQLDSYLQL